MLLELGDMVYSSVPDLDKWNGSEGSDFDCHSLDTLLAFSGQRVPHWKRWEISIPKSVGKEMVN